MLSLLPGRSSHSASWPTNSYTSFRDQLKCHLLWEAFLNPTFQVVDPLLNIFFFIESYNMPYGTNHYSN